MKLIRHFIFQLVPLGVIAAIVASMFSSSTPIQSEQVGALNVASGPGSAYNDGNFESFLTAEKAAGQTYAREVIDWSEVESTQGTYNWSTSRPLSAIFTAEKNAGMQVVAVLNGKPAYLGDSIDVTQYLVSWTNFVQAAVNQFGDQVDIWEIGSHVNTLSGSGTFLYPAAVTSSMVPDPSTYAQIVKAASKIIKNADPNDQVWMGSLVSAAAGSCAVKDRKSTRLNSSHRT